MSKAHIIKIEHGTAEFIYDDGLAPLLKEGAAKVRRASHVEPHPTKNGWLADMRPSGGPVIGKPDMAGKGIAVTDDPAMDDAAIVFLEPFETREEALAAELEWLRKVKGL